MHYSLSSTKFQWVMLLLLLALTMVGAYEEPFSELEIDEQLKILNKPAVKTIYTKHGDIFDCVNIYEQPAFDHPLLRNHTLQMKPTSSPKMLKDKIGPITSNGWLNESRVICPEGTVPLKRVTKEDLLSARSFSKSIESHGRKLGSSSKACPYDYRAGMFSAVDTYYGSGANLNVWSPNVPNGSNGYSRAEIGLANGDHFVETGWMVYPTFFIDAKPRFFARWTVDNYESTGCINIMCPGFVQTGNYPLGSVMDGISSYGDPNNQYDEAFQIVRDPVTHHWWLGITKIGIKVGYWPREVVHNLGAEGADSLYWGGGVCAPDDLKRDFNMGSGHFPNEGYSKAAYFNNIQYGVQEGNSVRLVDPDWHKVSTGPDKPNCFDVSDKDYNSNWGMFFYYGGTPNQNFECGVGPPN